jgi:hypothetical protein
MNLEWIEPKNSGGCPITSYALFRDDGITKNPIIEVNSINDPTVRNIPTLRQVSVTLANSDLGKTFTYVLYVFNREGSIMSEYVCYLFATIPDAASPVPTLVSASSTQITV